MAYDRYENRRDRSPDYDRSDRSGGRRDERGFFERAGDEIASWFGDDEADRRRSEDDRMNRDRGWNRDYGWNRNRDTERGYGREFGGRSRWREEDRNRWRQPRSERDYERMGYAGYDRDYSARGGVGGSSSPDYMSPTGPGFGYGGRYGAGTDSGYGGGSYGSDYRSSEYNRDRDRDSDRHYRSWRQRQMDELDSDYDRYNRERQERFENDFGTWRENRMGKRSRLGSIREHMDVVGSDGETVGKVDCVKGDHIVLTKGDSTDNRHHKLDCSMIETVEGDQVRLDIPAEEAKSRWEDVRDRDRNRDRNRERGFFGREDDRERNRDEDETNLNRSFSGTYENES